MTDPMEMDDAEFERYVDRQHDLAHAVGRGDFDRVLELLDAGADATDRGYPFLVQAVLAEAEDWVPGCPTEEEIGPPFRLVRLLLQRGADPNVRSRDGRTALDAARDVGHREACRLLEEHGGGHSG
jgi:hypothetical protein